MITSWPALQSYPCRVGVPALIDSLTKGIYFMSPLLIIQNEKNLILGNTGSPGKAAYLAVARPDDPKFNPQTHTTGREY